MNDSDFVEVAKALADPTRRRMLRELRDHGELTCSCLCSCFRLSQPTISHHIKTLQEAGLIEARKDGLFHRLTVNDARLQAFTRDLLGPKPARKPRQAGPGGKRSPRRPSA